MLKKCNAGNDPDTEHHGLLCMSFVATAASFSLPKTPTIDKQTSEVLHHDALGEGGKPAGAARCPGQCSVGKPWVLKCATCYLDMYHVPRHRLIKLFAVQPFTAEASLSRRINYAKTVQEWFEEHFITKCSRCRLHLQIPQISIPSSICGMYLKSDPWRLPALDLEDLKDILLRTPSEVLMLWPILYNLLYLVAADCEILWSTTFPL